MNKKLEAGRNDPCPCGSGKKFKKCCWGKELGPRKIKLVSGKSTGLTSNIAGSIFSAKAKPKNEEKLTDRNISEKKE